ncbi:hypothetical protein [Sphingomonas gilva]|nr:hypothetical protein [Sphingomonas gilva]
MSESPSLRSTVPAFRPAGGQHDALSEEGQMIARLGPLANVPVVVNAVEG